jgi:hypothetical protein
MYQSLSHDDGKTWSKPVIIAPNGVYPRLLRFAERGPGAELGASRRRSALLIRQARAHLERTVSPGAAHRAQRAGGFVRLHRTWRPLPETVLLIVYSWFKYPGSDGRARKAIMVRQITVQP